MLPGLDEPRHTVAERLAAELWAIKTRISDLEKSRPRVSFGPFDPAPTPAPVNGTMHVNTATNRIWVFGPTGWVSADAQRGYAESLGTVSTNSTAMADLGGPTVTLNVPPSGIVFAHIDVEVQTVTSGPNTATAAVGLYNATDIPAPGTSIQSAAGNASFERKITSPFDAGGATWPRGDLMVFRATPGIRSYTLRYMSALASVSVNFRNRKLWVATL